MKLIFLALTVCAVASFLIREFSPPRGKKLSIDVRAVYYKTDWSVNKVNIFDTAYLNWIGYRAVRYRIRESPKQDYGTPQIFMQGKGYVVVRYKIQERITAGRDNSFAHPKK
jgi:hypothetical protein